MTSIPKTFWRIFIDDPIPPKFEEFWDGFQRLHPTWQFMTLASPRLMWMRPFVHDIFDRCTTHAGRSDVLRYEVLFQFGGVYVDTDVECLRPFDDLVNTDKPFAGWEDHRMICPTVLGSPMHHPALGDLLNRLPSWFDEHGGEAGPPNLTTGPHLLTAMWAERTDVTLYPPVTLYPVHWSEKWRLGGPYPKESYAVHHWNASWLPDGPPQRPRPA